jgi:hypothetical protein
MAWGTRGGRGTRHEDSLPERRTQAREEGRRHGRAGAEPVAPDRATASRQANPLWPPLREALTAACRQRVAQRTGRDHPRSRKASRPRRKRH